MNRFNFIYDKFTNANNLSFLVIYCFVTFFLTLYLSPLYYEKSISINFLNFFGLVLLIIIMIEIFIYNIQYMIYRNRRERAERRNLAPGLHTIGDSMIYRPSPRPMSMHAGYSRDRARINHQRILEQARELREFSNRRTRETLEQHHELRERTLNNIRDQLMRSRTRDREHRDERRIRLIREQIEHMQRLYDTNSRAYNVFVDPNDPIINSIDDLYDE